VSETPETRDPLEAELEALRPADMPPEMFDRVGRAIAARDRPGRTWVAFAGMTGAAVAACAALALAWHVTRPDRVSPTPVVTTAPAAPDDEDDRPALANYHRALARSPTSLDELLDRHAARPLTAYRQTAGLGGGLADLRR
jgi:hypothetical protein